MVENILVSRGAGHLAGRVAEAVEPGRVADLAGYSPDLTLAQKVTVLETIDVVDRLRTVLAWAMRCWPTCRYASGSRPTSRSGWRRPSGAARKFVERGSCCHLGVVDPLEGLGRLAVVFDECQHLGHEVVT